MTAVKKLQADADPAVPNTEAEKLYGDVLNKSADLSGKLNDLMDEIAKLMFKVKKTDNNEYLRLKALREQIARADEAVMNIGTGLI